MQIASLLLALLSSLAVHCRGCGALRLDSTYQDVYYSTSQREETTTTELATPGRWPKPLVPICCSPGLYFSHSECLEDDEHESAPSVDFPEIFTADLQPSNMTADDFRPVYYYPCPEESFGIDPTEDVYYFLENGTIYTENLTYPALISQNDYCMALLRVENRTYVTVIAVCLPAQAELPKFFSVASLMSAIFLAFTFFIYVVIPDLQNIHGIVVMVYVVMLMIAYFALAIVQLGDQTVLEIVSLCRSLGDTIYRDFIQTNDSDLIDTVNSRFPSVMSS